MDGLFPSVEGYDNMYNKYVKLFDTYAAAASSGGGVTYGYPAPPAGTSASKLEQARREVATLIQTGALTGAIISLTDLAHVQSLYETAVQEAQLQAPVAAVDMSRWVSREAYDQEARLCMQVLADLYEGNNEVAKTIKYDTGLPMERCEEIAALVESARMVAKNREGG